MTITPITALDIFPDGKSLPAPDTAPRPCNGAAYRWLHLDLTDPDLPAWCAAHMDEDAADALQQTETRPRCDGLGNGLIVNLRGVNLNPGQETEDMVSLRMWVEPGLVISVRRRRIFAVEAVRQDALANKAPPSVADWVDHVAYGLTLRIEEAILKLEDTTDELEEALLEEEPRTDELAPLRRKLIKLHRFLAPQREALSRLAGNDTLVAPARAGLRESANRAARALETLNALTERAKAMQDHIHMTNAERMGRNGMILSIVASVFLPLGFLTGLFGVNLAGIPLAQQQWAFAALVGVCIVLGGGLLWIFRRLGWF